MTLDARRLFSTSNPIISGRDIPESKSERFPDVPLVDPWAGPLNDDDYLRLAEKLDVRSPTGSAAAIGLNFILSSEALWEPHSPTGKEYQGHIAICEHNGQQMFAAVSTYGPGPNPHAQAKVWHRSTTLLTCLDMVNGKLSEKRRKYEPKNRNAPANLGMSESDFESAFRVHPRNQS